MMTSHCVLELYSGIGGMHFAWKESGLVGCVKIAIDINTVANGVYKHNFPNTTLLNRNIQSITAEDINKMEVNVILMSPPCQPFTRNGNQKDVDDKRNTSLNHFLSILKDIHTVHYILLENVKGFESSISRDIMVEAFLNSGFNFREFLLSPHQIGIPNSRLRYYCIAKKLTDFANLPQKEIITNFPQENLIGKSCNVSVVLEQNINLEDYSIPDKFYKRAQVFDICTPDSSTSCCFTKAYTHYIEGTGSVFTEASHDKIKSAYSKATNFSVDSEEYRNELKSLRIRFFTPKEVARYMAFPDNFNFPENVSLKQKYRLLGNSINVKVVSELIKLLINES